MFANWSVDGTKYVFHENWLYQQNFPNLRISKPPSKTKLPAYFYLSEIIQKIQFAMTDPLQVLVGGTGNFRDIADFPLQQKITSQKSTKEIQISGQKWPKFRQRS